MVNPLTGQSDYRSALAQQLMAQGTQQQPIRTIGQGLGQLGQALSGALIQRGVQNDRQAALAEVLAARDSGQGFEQLMESENPYAQQFGAQALMAEMSREPDYVEVLGPDGTPRLMDAGQAAQLGLRPAGARTFAEEMALRREGAARTNVSMSPILNTAGSEFAEAWGGGISDSLMESVQTANSAAATNQILGQLETALQGVETGALTPARTALGNIAASLGVDFDTSQISNAQTALAAINDLLLEEAERMSGVLSDSDIRLLQETAASLTNLPEANRTIIQNARQRNQAQIEAATRQAEAISQGFQGAPDPQTLLGISGFQEAPSMPMAPLGAGNATPAPPPPDSGQSGDGGMVSNPELDTPGMAALEAAPDVPYTQDGILDVEKLQDGDIYRSGNDLVRFRNGRFEDVDPREVENANR